MQRICVFCGSSRGHDPRYGQAAVDLGQELARRGLGVVFGGGSVGLMGLLADAALAGGAEVIGVIPSGLAVREIAHPGVSDLRVVPTMHARKAIMADLADAFIALPGGLGTLEELLEVATWAQLGIHHKPIGILNVAGYFDPLLALIDHGVAAGFVPRESRGFLIVDDEPPRLLAALADHRGPAVREWVTPKQA